MEIKIDINENIIKNLKFLKELGYSISDPIGFISSEISYLLQDSRFDFFPPMGTKLDDLFEIDLQLDHDKFCKIYNENRSVLDENK